MSDPDFCHDLFIFKMCVKSFSLKLRYRAKLSLMSLPENEFIVVFFIRLDSLQCHVQTGLINSTIVQNSILLSYFCINTLLFFPNVNSILLTKTVISEPL